MRVSIGGREVIFDDDIDIEVRMTTDQLLEMHRILCLAIKEDNGLLFETVEFTV